jgi:hypothetical protein
MAGKKTWLMKWIRVFVVTAKPRGIDIWAFGKVKHDYLSSTLHASLSLFLNDLVTKFLNLTVRSLVDRFP